jgi:hypothetical protein
MTHLSADELRTWYQQGRVADRERVIGHLAGCDECRKALSLIAAEDAAEVAAPTVTAAEAVPLGYAARKAAPGQSRWAAWLRPAYALAGAALVVLAVLWLTPRPADDDGIRSSELLAIAPVGTSGALEFRWVSPFDAARYRITIRDAKGGVVVTAEARTSPTSVGRPPLKAGETYGWSVTALDQAGEVIAESRSVTFRFQPK